MRKQLKLFIVIALLFALLININSGGTSSTPISLDQEVTCFTDTTTSSTTSSMVSSSTFITSQPVTTTSNTVTNQTTSTSPNVALDQVVTICITSSKIICDTNTIETITVTVTTYTGDTTHTVSTTQTTITSSDIITTTMTATPNPNLNQNLDPCIETETVTITGPLSTGEGVWMTLSNPENIILVEGDFNKAILWTADSNEFYLYEVYLNNDSLPIMTGNFTGFSNIGINLEGLEPGEYAFKLVMYNNYGGIIVDEVIVTVLPRTSLTTTTETSDQISNDSSSTDNSATIDLPVSSLFVYLALIGSMVAISYRKR